MSRALIPPGGGGACRGGSGRNRLIIDAHHSQDHSLKQSRLSSRGLVFIVTLLGSLTERHTYHFSKFLWLVRCSSMFTMMISEIMMKDIWYIASLIYEYM